MTGITMALTTSCCTCASVLSIDENAYDIDTEKPIRHKTLPCCGRQVCALCIEKNPRFETYCPFCQTTRLPSLAKEQGKGESSKTVADAPPPYTPVSPPTIPTPPAPRPRHATLSSGSDRPLTPPPPPPYEATSTSRHTGNRPPTPPEDGEDVTHYLSLDDSFQSISLAYNVPAHILKAHNGIHSDNLLSARRKILIPATHYSGPSLSPNPLENPEEQERKTKIRKLMVKCKVAEYKVAVMYLEEAGWDIEKAEAKVDEDDRWEREHPISGSGSIVNVPGNQFPRRLRLAEPLSPRRIARLLS